MNPFAVLPARWCSWLQKDNPVGTVDRFPELRNRFETSVPGLYCIGDLTGIPLIKLATDSGHDFIGQLAAEGVFNAPHDNAADGVLDLVIIGAGPSGVAASLHAGKLGIRHVVLEATRTFNTIHNFPAGKPIYVTPADTPFTSELRFGEGTKETLLDELESRIAGKALPIRADETVTGIERGDDGFTVRTRRTSFRARRVAIAIGKTGNARKLGIPGEQLPHVYTRLIDPGEFHSRDIVVVGGGDSAVETAIALAKTGNRVTLSYRKASLSRPREANRAALDTMIEKGAVVPLYESSCTEIRDDHVRIEHHGETKTVPAAAVFVMIGTEIPVAFFRKADIRIEGEKRFPDWMKFAALLLFASVLYFGKKAPVTRVTDLAGFFQVPGSLAGKPWPKMFEGIVAWGSFLLLLLCTAGGIVHFARRWRSYFTTPWQVVKYGYFGAMLAGTMWLYIDYKLWAHRPLFSSMDKWYTLFYSVTIVLFGLRRIAVHPTGYIKRQTLVLMAIQVIPLCILPMFVLPALGRNGLLGDWIMTNVFPGHSYWRAFGFVLAWPLFIYTLATGQPTTFWLITGLVQSFVIIPVIVYRWGKGSYCGWICSCGALAETLGDEYRGMAPHGRTPKKWENAGQAILLFAVITTVAALAGGANGSGFSRQTMAVYTVAVDIFLAGVLGVGVYFFMSGRVWCRFFCPLAALMHIYARFSVYRIFADKKRCISCGICTKVCHMGIDVMGYANRGIPMNDVECVRCSACVVSCPMRVLWFGRLRRIDIDNTLWQKDPLPPAGTGWENGLPPENTHENASVTASG